MAFGWRLEDVWRTFELVEIPSGWISVCTAWLALAAKQQETFDLGNSTPCCKDLYEAHEDPRYGSRASMSRLRNESIEMSKISYENVSNVQVIFSSPADAWKTCQCHRNNLSKKQRQKPMSARYCAPMESVLLPTKSISLIFSFQQRLELRVAAQPGSTSTSTAYRLKRWVRNDASNK